MGIRDIKNKIVNSISNVLNKTIRRKIPEIEFNIEQKSLEIWKNTPTYFSLINPGRDNLYHQFGFHKGEAKELVDNFLIEASKDVKIEFSEIRGGSTRKFFGGGIKIYVLKQDLERALSSGFGSFMVESKKDKWAIIDWANWLLLEGNQIIVSQYKFVNGFEKWSRSGSGIMIKAYSGVWRVPSEHSGIKGDNWLTRSLTQSLKQISDEYKQIIERVINA